MRIFRCCMLVVLIALVLGAVGCSKKSGMPVVDDEFRADAPASEEETSGAEAAASDNAAPQPAVEEPTKGRSVNPSPKHRNPAPRQHPDTQGPLTPQEAYERCHRSVVPVFGVTGNQATSVGSSFVVAKNIVATNRHTVEGSSGCALAVGGQIRKASVVAEYSDLDLMLVKSDYDLPPPLPLGQNIDITPGSSVVALGYPLGGTDLGYSAVSITDGIIRRFNPADRSVQFSAPVDPGNSGGPLILLETGQVVGVVTSKAAEGENLGFAIPVDAVRELLERYRRG